MITNKDSIKCESKFVSEIDSTYIVPFFQRQFGVWKPKLYSEFLAQIEKCADTLQSFDEGKISLSQSLQCFHHYGTIVLYNAGKPSIPVFKIADAQQRLLQRMLIVIAINDMAEKCNESEVISPDSKYQPKIKVPKKIIFERKDHQELWDFFMENRDKSVLPSTDENFAKSLTTLWNNWTTVKAFVKTNWHRIDYIEKVLSDHSICNLMVCDNLSTALSYFNEINTKASTMTSAELADVHLHQKLEDFCKVPANRKILKIKDEVKFSDGKKAYDYLITYYILKYPNSEIVAKPTFTNSNPSSFSISFPDSKLFPWFDKNVLDSPEHLADFLDFCKKSDEFKKSSIYKLFEKVFFSSKHSLTSDALLIANYLGYDISSKAKQKNREWVHLLFNALVVQRLILPRVQFTLDFQCSVIFALKKFAEDSNPKKGEEVESFIKVIIKSSSQYGEVYKMTTNSFVSKASDPSYCDIFTWFVLGYQEFYISDATFDYKNMTIEHVYPQKPEKLWHQKGFPEYSSKKGCKNLNDEHNALCYQFGNLILTNGTLNSSMSNKFAKLDKIKELQESNPLFSSAFFLNYIDTEALSADPLELIPATTQAKIDYITDKKNSAIFPGMDLLVVPSLG